jgi:hypothetical protein
MMLIVSLLNTWTGKGTQKWDPKQSNLLQVVLSIQGLVLGTPDPYYLEAGYVLSFRSVIIVYRLSDCMLSYFDWC